MICTFFAHFLRWTTIGVGSSQRLSRSKRRFLSALVAIQTKDVDPMTSDGDDAKADPHEREEVAGEFL